jgi:hypothetical protein
LYRSDNRSKAIYLSLIRNELGFFIGYKIFFRMPAKIIRKKLAQCKYPPYICTNKATKYNSNNNTTTTAMKSAAQQKQSNRMSQVNKIAIQLYAACIASTQSEAMKLAWLKVKTLEKIEAGEQISFVKISTGEVRTVTTPAKYISTAPTTTTATTTKKTQPQLIVFCDMAKEGHNTISCDIRNLIF